MLREAGMPRAAHRDGFRGEYRRSYKRHRCRAAPPRYLSPVGAAVPAAILDLG